MTPSNHPRRPDPYDPPHRGQLFGPDTGHWSSLYDDDPIVIGKPPFPLDLDNDPIPKRHIGRMFLVVLVLLASGGTAAYVYYYCA